jgi:hypothetical protein
LVPLVDQPQTWTKYKKKTFLQIKTHHRQKPSDFVSWDVAPCFLVEVCRRFTSAFCLHHHGDPLMMEAVSTYETSVNLYQTTRRNIPEDSHYHTRR